MFAKNKPKALTATVRPYFETAQVIDMEPDSDEWKSIALNPREHVKHALNGDGALNKT